MKKLSLILASIISFASADLLSVSAGVGEWNQKISGSVKIGDTINYFNNSNAETDGNSNTGNFGLKDKTNPFVWIKITHPIPIIPNIKAQFTQYKSTGHSNYIAGNDIKIFGDVAIPTALTNADTEFKIDSYDITLFYEFKPAVADIEAGFGIDFWKGKVKITGTDTVTNTTKTWVDSSFSIPLPYIYGSVESMQFFGFSVLGDVKWAKAGDNHHYDYTGALKYTIDILGPVNPFIKIGYRYKDAQGKDGDDITQIKYKGVFAELGAKF